MWMIIVAASMQTAAAEPATTGQAAAQAAEAPAKDPVRCRTSKATGSHVKRTKDCRKLSEWKKAEEFFEDDWRRRMIEQMGKPGAGS